MTLAGRVSPFGDPRIGVWLPTPLGLSQVPTSFIASRRQGIHLVPFLAWPRLPNPGLHRNSVDATSLQAAHFKLTKLEKTRRSAGRWNDPHIRILDSIHMLAECGSTNHRTQHATSNPHLSKMLSNKSKMANRACARCVLWNSAEGKAYPNRKCLSSASGGEFEDSDICVCKALSRFQAKRWQMFTIGSAASPEVFGPAGGHRPRRHPLHPSQDA